MRKLYKMNKYILILMFLIINTNCKKSILQQEYTIDLINKSDHSIGYYFAIGGQYGTFYPDSLPESNNYIMYDISKVISPGYMGHLDWNEFFDNLPKDTLSVFIFHTDTLNKYTWSDIRDNYMILKRYDLSQSDLSQMNWTITYP